MKNKLNFIYFLLILSILTGLQNKASAQIGNPYLIYQSSFNNAMFLNTKNAIQRNIDNQKNGATTGSKASGYNSSNPGRLDFTSVPEVHAKVFQAMVKLMTEDDDAKTKASAEALNKADLLGKFDKLLRQYGFNSHNLADVFTAYVILSWQASTGNDAAQNPKGIDIFRRKMEAALGTNTSVLNFSNAQKQETAETLSYISTLITLANQDLQKKGDQTAIAQSRQNIGLLALKVTGMDVRRYSLSQAGFNLTK